MCIGSPAVDVDERQVHAPEELEEPRVVTQPVERRLDMGRKNLEGDRSIEPQIDRPIHFSHASHAQERTDFVRPKRGPGGKSHRGPRSL